MPAVAPECPANRPPGDRPLRIGNIFADSSENDLQRGPLLMPRSYSVNGMRTLPVGRAPRPTCLGRSRPSARLAPRPCGDRSNASRISPPFTPGPTGTQRAGLAIQANLPEQSIPGKRRRRIPLKRFTTRSATLGPILIRSIERFHLKLPVCHTRSARQPQSPVGLHLKADALDLPRGRYYLSRRVPGPIIDPSPLNPGSRKANIAAGP